VALARVRPDDAATLEWALIRAGHRSAAMASSLVDDPEGSPEVPRQAVGLIPGESYKPLRQIVRLGHRCFEGMGRRHAYTGGVALDQVSWLRTSRRAFVATAQGQNADVRHFDSCRSNRRGDGGLRQDPGSAANSRVRATSAGESQVAEPLDHGPFFHGTIADLSVDDLLTAGRPSNYRPEIVMNHVYFTALIAGAGLAAEIAAELAGGAPRPRVYAIEPTGPFENDPNVTDKKFPGNPTRSYRSSSPLRILGEITDWTRLTPQELRMWRDRLSVLLSGGAGEILN